MAEKKIVNVASLTLMKEIDTLEKRLNPFPVYENLRKESPVRFDPDRNCWDIFLYEDAEFVLKHHELFSSEQQRMVEGADNLLRMDPPRHKQMRDLVSKAFTPKAIQDLTPRIYEITEELLNNVIDQGEMNMIHDFAMPLPVIVIADLLGVPAEDRERFKKWSDVLVKGVEENTPEALASVKKEHNQVHKELTEYFRGIVAQRRLEPKNDIISALIAAEIDSSKLTEKEIIEFSILLLAAGNETTTNLITNGVKLLTERPDVQHQAMSDLSMIPSMIEEVLRFYPPVQAPTRIAKADVELRGKMIQRGQAVNIWVSSANRDEAKFPQPNEFQIDRKPNPHLTFGKGIHFCLGAPLARLEAKIAFEGLFTKMKDLKRKEGVQIKRTPSPQMYGFVEYPITFMRK